MNQENDLFLIILYFIEIYYEQNFTSEVTFIT